MFHDLAPITKYRLNSIVTTMASMLRTMWLATLTGMMPAIMIVRTCLRDPYDTYKIRKWMINFHKRSNIVALIMK